MGIQLVRICTGTHNVQILRSLRGAEEIAHSKGGSIPVQEYVSISQRWLLRKRNSRLLTDGRRKNRERQGTIGSSSCRY